MVKDILVGTILTDDMIRAGERFLADLVDSDLKILSAFWLFFSEAEEWRLVLVSPRVDKEGPRKLYEELAQNIYEGSNKKYGLELRNFTFFSPRELPTTAIAGANVIHDISRKHIGKLEIGGTYVGDMYLYFVSEGIRAYVPASLSYERPRNPHK